MREILFRGKGTHGHKTGKWVYGNYAKDFWGINNKGFGIMPIEGGYNEVDPETVGQFTGLTDKNGTKIFEGDIVKRNFFNKFTHIYQVNFNIGLLAFIAQRNGGFSTLDDEFEIVGNIHDNPELLESEVDTE